MDDEFQSLISELTIDGPPNLSMLVPEAYNLLQRALSGDSVPASKANVALAVLKAAATVETAGAQESSFAKRLEELDSVG